jgi:hypothetical protein
MRRTFSKYDGKIIKSEDFEDTILRICSMISSVTTSIDLNNIIRYLNTIENISELRDSSGKNLLMCASGYNNLDLIKYFISRGIDINSVDNDNSNILLYINVLHPNMIEISTYLIENGIDVFHTDNRGLNIFDILYYLNNTTPSQTLREHTEFLLKWYGEKYMPDNFIKDPNFVKNIKSILKFDASFIYLTLQYIDKYIIDFLEELIGDFENVEKIHKERKNPIVSDPERISGLIEILRDRLSSDITENIINNLNIRLGEDTKKKLITTIISCKKLLKIARDKRNEINTILRTEISERAAASLEREYAMEKKGEKNISEPKTQTEKNREKKRKQIAREKQKKEREKLLKIDQDISSKELELMGKEDTMDMRFYYNTVSYLLAEQKIEEIKNEIIMLLERGATLEHSVEKNKIQKQLQRQIEKIKFTRNKEKHKRENFKMEIQREARKIRDKRERREGKKEINTRIDLDSEDEEYTKRFMLLQQELQRSLENDDEILAQLEDIYKKQEETLGYGRSEYSKK